MPHAPPQVGHADVPVPEAQWERLGELADRLLTLLAQALRELRAPLVAGVRVLVQDLVALFVLCSAHARHEALVRQMEHLMTTVAARQKKDLALPLTLPSTRPTDAAAAAAVDTAPSRQVRGGGGGGAGAGPRLRTGGGRVYRCEGGGPPEVKKNERDRQRDGRAPGVHRVQRAKFQRSPSHLQRFGGHVSVRDFLTFAQHNGIWGTSCSAQENAMIPRALGAIHSLATTCSNRA